MKSVLFIMNYSVEGKSRRKYDDQMNACTRLGLEVWCLGTDDNNVYLCRKSPDGLEKTLLCKRSKPPIQALWENYLYISLYKSVPDALKIKGDFTYCYMRRYFFEKSTCRALKILQEHNTKTIIEIPTYPHTAEQSSQKGLKSRAIIAVGNHYEKKAARYVDLFCPMGEHCDTILGRPALNIENGIDVTDIKLREPRFDEGAYHIACLALMTFWHGYDRLICSLADYIKGGGQEKIYLHMIGEGAILDEWRALAERLGVAGYVIFEGKMDNARMNEFFDSCDLGAASLGRYRSSLSVVYELKTREYMARGLPFIYATDDWVVHSFGKYCVRVENSDAPIDMCELVDFMKEMRALPGAPAEMRAFAAEQMSFDRQFEKIFC